ncbi:hypothetical protein Tco_1235630 [Tanacetum coccineum]
MMLTKGMYDVGTVTGDEIAALKSVKTQVKRVLSARAKMYQLMLQVLQQRLRLRLIMNWLKECKQRSKKSFLLKKGQNYLEQRRKHFAAKSAEEKRNKPPTQAQQRKIMKMFDRAFKRANTFVDFITDLAEGSSKRAGEELEQESTKKQKVDEDKDTT